MSSLLVLYRAASWSSLSNAVPVKDGEESAVSKLENEVSRLLHHVTLV